MALTVETGAGVAGADSYDTVANISAYWEKRQHIAIGRTWTAATDPEKEGAAREATAYLDARYGGRYRGTKKSATQGLLWPRLGDDGGDVLDPDGFALAAVPVQLKAALAEIAARAVSGALSPDIPIEGRIKTHKVGDVQVTFDTGANQAGGAATAIDRTIGIVDAIMAPILDADGSWPWR